MIGFTSDNHLIKGKYPERVDTFSNILSVSYERGVNNIFIAGDLFDAPQDNYKFFEDLVKEFPDVRLHIIPGNHDYKLKQSDFTLSNILIYSDPKVVTLEGVRILLIPYKQKMNAAEVISEIPEDKLKNIDLLVSHGDYIHVNKEINHYEPGIYMALSKNDILKINPEKVILGHIHIPHKIDNVNYIGSPCGLDINETGRRRFLIYYEEERILEDVNPNPPVLYLNERILVTPGTDEEELLINRLNKIKDKWELSDNENNIVNIRVSLIGFAVNVSNINKVVQEFVKKNFPNSSEEIKADELKIFDDSESKDLLDKFESKMKLLKQSNKDLIDEELVFNEAMKIIFNT